MKQSFSLGSLLLQVRIRLPSFLSFPSLKREMRKLAQEDCGFEEPTVAMAFVYFEKLALKGKLNKQNRKLCAGACVLLAAKIGSDLKKHEVKHLIDVSGPCPYGWGCTRASPVSFSWPWKPPSWGSCGRCDPQSIHQTRWPCSPWLPVALVASSLGEGVVSPFF